MAEVAREGYWETIMAAENETRPVVAIVDYHKGNLSAVERALAAAEARPLITDSPDEMKAADGLVIPGVGSFEDAMGFMRESGQVRAIELALHKGTPLLGICLGLQLLFQRGNESDDGHWVAGYGHFRGQATRLPSKRLKVPHMGWDSLDLTPLGRTCPLLEGVSEGATFYFTHSYAVVPSEEADYVCARTHYAESFASVVWRGNVYGCQFHPEKSSEQGAVIMRNFVRQVSAQINAPARRRIG